jgi:hypothetical protein
LKISKRAILVILIVLFSTGFPVINIFVNANKLEPSPAWHEISPGITTNVEVENILGKPANVFYSSGETIYVYENLIDIGWKKVEVSISQPNLTVQGILLLYPIEDEWESFSIDILLDNYGKPNFISWTSTPFFRLVAWTKHGISVECWTYPLLDWEKPGYDKLKINGVFLFQPITKEEFRIKKWNFPDFVVWSSENYSSPKYTDAPDTQPRNPLGWILFP